LAKKVVPVRPLAEVIPLIPNKYRFIYENLKAMKDIDGRTAEEFIKKFSIYESQISKMCPENALWARRLFGAALNPSTERKIDSSFMFLLLNLGYYSPSEGVMFLNEGLQVTLLDNTGTTAFSIRSDPEYNIYRTELKGKMELVAFLVEDKSKEEGPTVRDRGRLQLFAHSLAACLQNAISSGVWDKKYYSVVILYTKACVSQFYICDFPVQYLEAVWNLRMDDYSGELPTFHSFPRGGLNLFTQQGRETLLSILGLFRERLVSTDPNQRYEIYC
jgi:hypothetical protein